LDPKDHDYLFIAHANSNTYGHGHADSYCYTDINGDGHRHRYPHIDAYGNINGDGYIYAKAFADSKGLTSVEAAPDSGTAPVSGYHRGRDSALRCPNPGARRPYLGSTAGMNCAR
jgi:hypothetical protein